MSGGTLSRPGAVAPFRRRTDNPALALSRVALVIVAGVFLLLAGLGIRLPLQTQSWLYLFGMVALNLPHGGYEHFSNLRRRQLDFRWRYLALYVTMVAAFVGLFFLAPVAGLALAITVAVAKGGLGGVSVLDATTGTDHLRTRPQRLLAAAVRGGAVMAVPIFAWPGVFQTFSHYMVAIFDPGAMAAVAPYFDVTRWLVGGAWAVAAAAHIGLGYVRGGETSWLVDAGETVLLGVYFYVVPVVVAVGLYFPLWYSTRQVARSLAVAEQRGTGGPDLLDFDRPEHITLAGGRALSPRSQPARWCDDGDGGGRLLERLRLHHRPPARRRRVAVRPRARHLVRALTHPLFPVRGRSLRSRPTHRKNMGKKAEASLRSASGKLLASSAARP
jgi:Brp/Blh family beta-carotene 15,15'-monooxygenase